MKKIDQKSLEDNLVDHPYDSNPDYFAKIAFLYFSPDKKVVSFYWEAPVGNFDYKCVADEILYIIEGEVELVSTSKSLTIKKGELYSAKDGDKLKFIIKKSVKSFGFMYPANKESIEEIEEMIRKGKRP